MKLIMTLLVRDEEDILEKNIKFHLNCGVDFIVAIDNGSRDGTRDILDKYQKMGVLAYRVIREHTYEQDKWVSGMARMAVEKYGADRLMHVDADEFWLPKCSSLKRAFAGVAGVWRVPVVNYLPPECETDIFDFNDFGVVVAKVKSVPFAYEDKKTADYFLYTYPMKLVTTDLFLKIGYGNDTVHQDGEFEDKVTTSVFIHHFPIRSYKHFERKVVNGGSAYAKNPIKNPNLGWHWRKWYAAYRDNKLLEEYKMVCLAGKIERLLDSGVLKKSRVPGRVRFLEAEYWLRSKINDLFQKS